MDAIRIVVTSANPVKRQSVERAFQQVFQSNLLELIVYPAHSGVSSQPLSEEETLRGAMNRAQAAVEVYGPAAFCVGIEGGVASFGADMLAFAWVAICFQHRWGKARTASFLLPKPIQHMIQAGMELGEADDQYFGTQNSKQNQGAVGLLTHGLIDRTSLYTPAVILALIPFIKQ